MDENRVGNSLRDLPRVEAAPHFTAAVLRRVREPRVSRGWFSAPQLAVAAAVVLLVVAVFGLREWDHARERAAAVARIEALRAEQRALETELEALRRMHAAAQPVVYLGHTDNVDLVLDLRRVRSHRFPTYSKTRQDI